MDRQKMQSESCFKYYNLLTDEHKTDLGPVNLNWFDDLTENAGVNNLESSNKEVVTGIHNITTTEPLNGQDIGDSFLFGCSPSFGSPDNSISGPKKGVTNQGGSSCHTAAYGNDVTLDSFFGLSPLCASRDRKHWFKTPNSVPRSHGKRLALSLGVDLHGPTNVSWTSSLATPQANIGTAKKHETPEVDDEFGLTVLQATGKFDVQHEGAARALFSPGAAHSQDDLAFGLNSTVDTESEEFLQEKKLHDFDAGRCMYKSTPVVANKQPGNAKGRLEEHESLLQARKEPLREVSLDDLFEDVKDISTNDKTLVHDISRKFTISTGKESTTNSVVNDRGTMQQDNVDVFEDVLSIFVSPLTQNSQSSLRLSNRPLRKRKLSMNEEKKSQKDSQKSESDISSQQSEASSCKKAKLSLSPESKGDTGSSEKCEVADFVAKDNHKQQSNGLNEVLAKGNKEATEVDNSEVAASIEESQEKMESHTSTSNRRTIVGINLTPSKPSVDIPVSPVQDCFTQISPTSLSAMYDAAEMPPSDDCMPSASLEKPIHVKSIQIHQRQNGQKDLMSTKPNFEGVSREDKNERKTLTLRMDEPAKAQHISPLFSSGDKSTKSGTPLRWKTKRVDPTIGVKNVFDENKNVSANTKPTESKSLSLKNRKTKRFSYPSTSQITEVCPQRIFNFEVLKSTESTLDKSSPHVLKKENDRELTDNMVTDVTQSNALAMQNTTEHTDNRSTEVNDSNIVTKLQNIPGFTENRCSDVTQNNKTKLQNIPGCESSVVADRDLVDHHKEEKLKREIESKKTKQKHSAPRCTSGFVTLTSYNKLNDQNNQGKARQHPTHTVEEYKERFQKEPESVTHYIKHGTGEGQVEQKQSLEDIKALNKVSQHHSYPAHHTKTAAASNSSSHNSVSLQGFACASGKSIQLSTQALEKAQNMMKDIEKEIEGNLPQGNPKAGLSEIKSQVKDKMQKENGKTSKGYLFPKGNKAPDGGKSTVREACLNKAENKVKVEELPGGHTGFKCASGKAISISTKAEIRARSLMKDLEKEFSGENDIRANETEVLSDITDNCPLPTDFDSANNHGFPGGNGGFKCASGKDIIVSTKAEMRAKSLMKEIDKDFDQGTSENDGNIVATFAGNDNQRNFAKPNTHSSSTSTSEMTNKTEIFFPGFQSASGKSIDVSHNAMRKANELINEVENQVEGSSIFKSSMSEGNKGELTVAGGFQSASGKSIKVSDKSLKQANKLMDEVECQVESKDSTKVDKSMCLTSGFQSASGKGLALSESSIHRAHLLMQEVNSERQQTTSDGVAGFLDHNLENLENTVKDLSHQGRQPTITTVQQRNQERKVVPQGFRPFKPPRMSKLPDKLSEKSASAGPSLAELSTKNTLGKKADEEIVCSETDFTHNKSEPLKKERNIEVKPHLQKNSTDIADSSREIMDKSSVTEGFTLTQMAEISEGTAAFFELDEDTQFAFKDSKDYGKDLLGESLLVEDDGQNSNLDMSENGPQDLCEENVQIHEEAIVNPPVELSQNSVERAKHFLEEEFNNEISQVETGTKDPIKVPRTEERTIKEDISLESIERDSIRGSDRICLKTKATDSICDGSPPKFVGFKTASGKCLKISEESIKKAQNVLEMGDFELESENIEYETTSGKNLKVSENSVNKDQKILEMSNSGSDAEVVADSKEHVASLNPESEASFAVKSKSDVPREEFVQSKYDQSSGPETKDIRIQESGYSGTFEDANEEEHRGEFLVPQQVFDKPRGNTLTVSRSSLFSADPNDSGCVDVSGNISIASEMQSTFLAKSKQDTSFIQSLPEAVPHGNNMDESMNMQKSTKFQDLTKKDMDNDVSKVDLNEDKQDVGAKEIQISHATDVESHFMGFQTASGKNVAISEDSLRKARSYLADDNSDTLITNKQESLHCLPESASDISFKSDRGLKMADNFPIENKNLDIDTKSLEFNRMEGFNLPGGFQTAGGQKVSASDNALNATKKMFHEEQDFPEKDSGTIEGSTNSAKICTLSSGFQTATRNNVNVSDEDLKRAQKVFRDDETQLQTKSIPKSNIVAESSRFTGGFQTASGNKVIISEKALNAAKEMFDNESNSFDKEGSVPRSSEEINTSTLSCGFQTAGGNKVQVSELALNAAKKLVHEESLSPGKDKSVGKSHESCTFSRGFQTASGNKVNISEKALNEAKKVFSEETASENVRQSSNEATSSRFTGGFQTASGNEVNISEKAFKAAKKMFSDETHPPTESETVGKSSEEIKPCTFTSSFQIASGSTVSVSGNALKTAKKIFHEESQSPNEFAIVAKSRDTTELDTFSGGFQTASGNMVNISEKALKAAKKMFDDETHSVVKDQNVVNSNTGADSCPFPGGFQTASGNKVKVSDHALKAAKNLFNDETDLSVTNTVSEKPCENVHKFSGGFQTAGGNEVAVSDHSLKAVKQLLSDSSLAESYATEKSKDNLFPQTSEFSFQTASGNKVMVSDTAMSAAKKLLQDDVQSSATSISRENDPIQGVNVENQSKLEALVPEMPTTVSVGISEVSGSKKPGQVAGNAISLGFQTARGTKVNISDQAIARAKKFFNDDNDDVGNQSDHENAAATKYHKGSFSKSPSKPSTIKKVVFSLEKNEVTNSNANSVNQDSSTAKPDYGKFTGGFQTARGHKVNVSDKALKVAKQFLHEEESSVIGIKSDDGNMTKIDACKANPNRNVEMQQQSTSSVTIPGGFQTASGVKVNVSEKAIEAAKKVLNEENNSSFKQTDIEIKQNQGVDYDKSTGSLGETADHTRSTALQEKSKPLSLTQEAVASAHALMEDGEFDDWLSQGQCESSTKPRIKPCITSPESYVGDRKPSSLSPKPTSLVTVPARDVLNAKNETATQEKYRWKGSTQFKSKAVPHVVPSDRRGLLIHKQSPPVLRRAPARSTASNIQSLPPATKHKIIQDSSRFRFNTPNKKDVGSFSTPSKQVNAESSFVTPFKKTEASSFKTPMKSTPVKCTAPDTVEESDMPDLAMLEKLMSDENAPEEEVVVEPPDQNMIESHIEVSSEVKKARLKARVAQAQRIKCKRDRCNTKPVMGRLMREKRGGGGGGGGKMSLKDVVGTNIRPTHYSNKELYSFGVHQSTLTVSSATAEGFRFRVSDFYDLNTATEKEGVLVGDGVLLVMDELSTAGKEEFCNALLDMDGVEPKLISRDWVYNHYRWIVWKLAAYEVALPQQFASRCLKPDQVMLQLKYRYDREIDHSQRSALKKIYEKDDSPQKCMVLCVASVIALNDSGGGDANNKGSTGGLLELTDGWYPIKAVVDTQLCRCVRQGRLSVGDKLMVYGAELLGSQDGSLPLEAPGDVMLKISTNSARRVSWWRRLGYCRQPQPPPLPLSSLYPDGGLVGCVDVVVTRVYPTLYLEKHAAGTSTFRSERAEEKARKCFEREKQKHQETLFAKLQKEFEMRFAQNDIKTGGVRRQWSSKEVSALDTECELYEAFSTSADTAHFTSLLSSRQKSLLENYKSKVFSDKQADLQADFQTRLLEAKDEIPSRNVTPLLKVRITGCSNADIDTESGNVYTVWRPSEEVMNLLQEGQRLHLYNVMASELRGKVQGTGSCRSGLTATRTTCYQRLEIDDNLLDLVYEPREVVSLTELKRKLKAACAEVDIVATVISVMQSNQFQAFGGGDSQNTTVYLAGPEAHFVAVKFWGGLNVFGLEDIVKPGVCLACTNLTHKEDFTSRIPVVFASETSLFTTNPKGRYLKVSLEKQQNLVQKDRSYISRCQDELHNLMTMPLSSGPMAKQFGAEASRNSPRLGRTQKGGNLTLSSKKYDNNAKPLENRSPYGACNKSLAEMHSLNKQNDSDINIMIKENPKSHIISIKQDDLESAAEIDGQCEGETQLNEETKGLCTPYSSKKQIPQRSAEKCSVQKSKAEKLDNFMDNLVQMSPGLRFNTTSPQVSLPKACKAPGLRRRSVKLVQSCKTDNNKPTSPVKDGAQNNIDPITTSKLADDVHKIPVGRKVVANADSENRGLLKHLIKPVQCGKTETPPPSLKEGEEQNTGAITQSKHADDINETPVEKEGESNVDSQNSEIVQSEPTIHTDTDASQSEATVNNSETQRKGKRKKSSEHSSDSVENSNRRKSLRLSRQK